MKLVRYNRPSLETWSPTEKLTSLRDEMNRLFEFAFPSFTRGELLGDWAPSLDVFDEKEALVVKAELPGMKKEEIEISILEGALTISGERKREEEHKDADTYRCERSFGRFSRSVVLPATVDAAKVTAAYKDGVLTVTLPKSEEAKPKKIDVSVQ